MSEPEKYLELVQEKDKDSMNILVKYLAATEESGELPPIEAPFYEYVFAGNGVFVRAKRAGLEAMVPVAFCRVRGLADVEPYCRVDYLKIPAQAIDVMLSVARDACEWEDKDTEVLFHIWWSAQEGKWKLEVPDQEGDAGHVIPLESGPDSTYARAFLEVHSHHNLEAYFSSTDNKDEQGFRLYGVLGTIFARPTLRLRVGIYGYFMHVPLSTIFDGNTTGVDDAYARIADKWRWPSDEDIDEEVALLVGMDEGPNEHSNL